MSMLPNHRRNTFWVALFVLLASSLVLPLLAVNEPPLGDYPNHLARTFILDHLHDPAFHFSEYYRADWSPYPYILWDILMVALQQVLPAEAAGKLLLMLITVLLPVALAWFLWEANRSEIKLSLLACALSFYSLFLLGMTAYQLSVGLCFLMIGTWLWYRRKPSVVRAVLFFVLSFATYFAHLLGFASAAFILVLYEFTQFNWRESLRLACFLAPPSLLSLWARPGLREQSDVVWRPILWKLRLPLSLLLRGYDTRLDVLFASGLLLCFLVAVVRNRELRVNKRWLAVALSFYGVFLLLPMEWGSSTEVDSRLVPPLCLLMLAVFRVGRRANWLVVLAVALTALRVFNITTGFHKETQKSAAMNHGIEQIARNARVFPLVDVHKDNGIFDQYEMHYWAYAVIRRGATSCCLFDTPGQTPMRTKYEPYIRDFEGEEIGWKSVSLHYDYIWNYGDEYDSNSIKKIAYKVFEEGPLILYRVRE